MSTSCSCVCLLRESTYIFQGLTVNVYAPSSAKQGDNLPVVAVRLENPCNIRLLISSDFTSGSTAVDLSCDSLVLLGRHFPDTLFRGGSSTYPGSTVVSRSIALGQPLIFVSMNYR